MDKHQAQEKAANLGGILAAFFLTAGVLIAAQLAQSIERERVAAEVASKQAALAEKQRVLQGLETQVAQQRTVIAELSSRAGTVQSVEAGPWETYTATWYSPAGGQGDGRTTKSGAPVKQQWTVAVDPHLIPLGSLVEVRYPDGTDRIYKATDTGGAIRGRHIDVFDWNEQKCLQNGRQTVMLRILVRGK